MGEPGRNDYESQLGVSLQKSVDFFTYEPTFTEYFAASATFFCESRIHKPDSVSYRHPKNHLLY